MATKSTKISIVDGHNYSVDSGDGNLLTAGLQWSNARSVAQDLADSLKVSVYVYAATESDGKTEEIVPRIDTVVTRHGRSLRRRAHGRSVPWPAADASPAVAVAASSFAPSAAPSPAPADGSTPSAA